MKRQIFAILFAIFGILFYFSGCMQAIVDKPDGTRYKVNTFLYRLDIDKITGEIITVERWRGKADEVDVYSPVGTFHTE